MKTLDLIKQPIIDELVQFETCFSSRLSHSDPFLHSVLQKVAESRGKGMRPVLVLLIAKLLGGVGDKTYLTALSYELVHTASLIHDDVLDDSNQRRGKPSINALFGDKMAILLGDYLLGMSVSVLSEIRDYRVTESVSYASSSLANGEILQMHAMASDVISEQAYFDVIRAKTASLFASCAKGGAISVDTSEEALQRFFRFGLLLGEAFQIKDDVFDYDEKANIGKPTGNDLLEGKLTLPLIYALNSAPNAEMLEFSLRARRGESTAEQRKKLVSYAVEHGGIAYAYQKMEQNIGDAKALLSSYPDSEVKNALMMFADLIAERDH